MAIILYGKTGAGKSSIRDKLCEKYGYYKAITYTTREKRVNENNGIDYYFISQEEFFDKMNSGFFLESDKFISNGITYYYASSKKDYINKKIVFVLSSGGYWNLKNNSKEIFENSIHIYLDVNKEVQKERLIKRGDDINKANNRIISEEKEYNEFKSIVDLQIDTSYKNKDEIAEEIYKYIQNRGVY